MRLYVSCRFHPTERIYLRFQTQPSSRAQVPISFSVVCPQGFTAEYSNTEVIAEVGAAPLVGAGLGALLVFLDPVVGIVAGIAGLLGARAIDQKAVEDFNQS